MEAWKTPKTVAHSRAYHVGVQRLSNISNRGKPPPPLAIEGEKTQLDPTGTTTLVSSIDIEELGPEGQGLQTASDGKTVLIPQPSGDPNEIF